MLCLSGFELYSRWVPLNVWNKHDLNTRDIVRRYLRVCLNNRGFPFFFVARWSCRAWCVLNFYWANLIFFAPRHTFRGQEDGPCMLGNYFLKIKILASFVFTQDHFFRRWCSPLSFSWNKLVFELERHFFL